MRKPAAIVALLPAILLLACTEVEPPPFDEPMPLSVPAGNNVFGPRLSASPDGDLVLSWMQREESGATLRFSKLEFGKWTDALDVVTDEKMFVNWADLPSVTPFSDEHWVAHWLSKSADATYAYDILVSQSTDQGQSWSEPLRPHTDGTPTEHGFVSMHRSGDSAALIWLDGRKTGNEIKGDPRASAMTLRYAVVGPTGALSNEQLVDEMICDCCQTDVAVSSDGPIAVYRNRTREEIRDIYVTRFSDGDWEPGAAIADDGWEIAGCPVNGPVIDAEGDIVAVAWFSGAGNKPVVRAAISTNAGRTFKKPVEIASRRSSGHVGVAIIDRTSIAVSWVQADNRGTHAVNIRGLSTSGLLGRVHTIGRTSLPKVVPQLARSEDRLIVAWTDEIAETTRVVSVEVPIVGFYDFL